MRFPDIRSRATAARARGAASAAIALAGGVLLFAGCATPLESARENFYRGRFDAAERNLGEIRVADRDRILFLMERGTVRQARGDFEASSRDFIEASDLLETSEAYSVSKGATSLVINDTVQTFRGTPYERTLLHAMTAQNHFSLERWDDAAVEARRIIESMSPERKKDYPEDAFSRYVAGFALEMIDDPSNAAIQYRLAAAAARGVAVDPETGAVRRAPRPPDTNTADAAAAVLDGPGIDNAAFDEWFQQEAAAPPAPPEAPDPAWRHELVCFVLLGRAADEYDWLGEGWTPGAAPYAEIFAGDRLLGRTWPLADTMDLAYRTAQKDAARKAAKAAARLAIKHALSEYAAHESGDENLGSLVAFLLIPLLEQPDVRRWETLPRWLQVGRFPCPDDPGAVRVVLHSPGGGLWRSETLPGPFARRRGTSVLLYRDLPKPPPAPAPATQPDQALSPAP